MKMPLTDKQAAALEFRRAFAAENDNMPTGGTIAKHFGWASFNNAFEVLQALKRKGYIERNAQGTWRFTREPVEVAS